MKEMWGHSSSVWYCYKKHPKYNIEKCIKQTIIKEGDGDVCFHYFYSTITKGSRKHNLRN